MPTVATATRAAHHKTLEIGRPEMAKASLKEIEIAMRPLIGRAIARAFALAGWDSLKVAGAKLNRDVAQLSRWTGGSERPQFDVLFGQPELREPLVTALAELAQADVRTVIEFRRVR